MKSKKSQTGAVLLIAVLVLAGMVAYAYVGGLARTGSGKLIAEETGLSIEAVLAAPEHVTYSRVYKDEAQIMLFVKDGTHTVTGTAAACRKDCEKSLTTLSVESRTYVRDENTDLKFYQDVDEEWIIFLEGFDLYTWEVGTKKHPQLTIEKYHNGKGEAQEFSLCKDKIGNVCS